MSDYQTGYENGESSEHADWTCAMNERAGIPEEFSGDIPGVVAYVKALRSIAFDHPHGERAIQAEIERRARKVSQNGHTQDTRPEADLNDTR